MAKPPKQHKVNDAMRVIQGYQSRQGGAGRSGHRWRLEVPPWQLALEGLAAFAIAFVSGLGLGVFYQVLLGA